MRYEDFKKISTLYLYGEISPEERKAFEDHIAKCEGCREEIEKLQKVKESLDRVAADEPAMSIRSSILQFAHEHGAAEKSIREKLGDLVFRQRKLLRFCLGIIMFVAVFIMMLNYIQTGGVRAPTISPSPTASPAFMASQEAEEISGNLDEKIVSLKRELEYFNYANMDFRDSHEFYNPDRMVNGRYAPFSDSRPFRRISVLSLKMNEVAKRIKSF